MADRTALGEPMQPMTRMDNAGEPSRGMGSFTRASGTKPINAPYTLEEDYKDHRKPEKVARLYEESVGFPNLANDQFVVAQAKSAVQGSLQGLTNTNEFLRNKWLVFYRLYRGETLSPNPYGRPWIHSPEPFKIVETIHPRVMRTLFGSERWYTLHSETQQRDGAAKAQEALTREQFRAMSFYAKASKFVRDGLIYGTAIQKVWWKQKQDEITFREGTRKPDKKFPGRYITELNEIKRTELVFDGNYIDNVSIFDFCISPTASSIDDAEWCADRSQWADYDVKRQGEMGHWLHLDQLRDHRGTKDMTFGDEFKERKNYAYGVYDPRDASAAPHIPHYEVIDWWGPLVIRKQGSSYETKMVNVVMIDPQGLRLVVRVTENPFWHRRKPYQAWQPIDLEDEFYGIGALEPIARLSSELDEKDNLFHAATQLSANPMMMISDDANIPDGQLIISPGKTFRVPDVTNAMAPVNIPDVSDAALKSMNQVRLDIRETAGTTSPSMGTSDPFGGAKTATQHTSEVNEANTRMADIIENYERQVIVPMLEQMAWNNQQFMSYPRVVRDIGPMGRGFQDRYTIAPEDILGRFIVQPLASYKLQTKQVMVQQLTNILDRAPIINQMYGPDAVKMPKLLAYILEFGFDIRNADEFIKVPPEEGQLMTADEEQEMWYQGVVPPRRPDDNDMRHTQSHMEEFGTPRFQELEARDPATAGKARIHTAEHMRKLMLAQDQQEKVLMEMAQAGAAMGLMGGNVPGAGSPDQEPGSPKVRSNENERGEGGGGGAEKSEAMRGAPNGGAQ